MNSMEDMETQKLRSLKKVTDAWKNIIEKYSQLDEQGDVIDIRTGKLIEDSGHLKSLRDSSQIKEDVWQSLNIPDSGGEQDVDNQNSNPIHNLHNKDKYTNTSGNGSRTVNSFTSIPLTSDSDIETTPPWYTLSQPAARRRTTRSSISHKDNLRLIPLSDNRQLNGNSIVPIGKVKRHDYPNDQLKLSGLNLYDSQSYKDSSSLVKSMPVNAVGPLITPSKVKRFKEALENKSLGNVRLKKLLLINRQKKKHHHLDNKHNQNNNSPNLSTIKLFPVNKKSPYLDVNEKAVPYAHSSIISSGSTLKPKTQKKGGNPKKMFKDQKKFENFIQDSTSNSSTMNKNQVINFLNVRMGFVPRMDVSTDNKDAPSSRLRGRVNTPMIEDSIAEGTESGAFTPYEDTNKPRPENLGQEFAVSNCVHQTPPTINKQLENSDSEDDLEIIEVRNVENVDDKFLANDILYEEDTFFSTNGSLNDNVTEVAQPIQPNGDSQAHAEMTKFTIDAMREDSSELSDLDHFNRMKFQKENPNMASQSTQSLGSKQLLALKKSFQINPNPNRQKIISIACEIGLTYEMVLRWFMNEKGLNSLTPGQIGRLETTAHLLGGDPPNQDAIESLSKSMNVPELCISDWFYQYQLRTCSLC